LQFSKLLRHIPGERLSLLGVGRHVDSARLHDHRVDKAVDVFEVNSALARPVESELRLIAGLDQEVRYRRCDAWHQAEHRDDGVEFWI